MTQLSFLDVEQDAKHKRTLREIFLSAMGKAVP
jgi:hypothetical protein